MAGDSAKTAVGPLGQPFGLGLFYDCSTTSTTKDSLIPALTFWDREVAEKDAAESQPYSDKSTALNIEASGKYSFLCGLVDIDGSKISENQARVLPKCNKTTNFTLLSMNPIGKGNGEHPCVIHSGEATEEVTGILYGAFFVPDHKVLPNPKPSEKNNTKGDKDSCKFHEETSLKKQVSSLSLKVNPSLPKLMGTNRENSERQKIWLMPIKTQDSTTNQLVEQITERLIKDAENVRENLNKLQKRLDQVEKCAKTLQFPQMLNKVKAFTTHISLYKNKWPNMEKEDTPMQSDVLAKILEKLYYTPDLHETMDSIEGEMKTISDLISDQMPNITIVPTLNKFDSGDEKHTVCFVFTSLEAPEHNLSVQSNYSGGTQPDNEPCANDVEKEQWFSSKEIMNKVQKKAKLFKDFENANKGHQSIRFLTTAISNDEMQGATVHLYKGDSSTTLQQLFNDFEPPSIPEMIPADISHNSVTLTISPPQFGSTPVTHYTVEFCVHGEDVWHEQKESKAGDVTVSGLRVNEVYWFRCRAVCAVGLGPACEKGSVKTLPSSAPEKLQAECTSTELSVRWEKPSELGPVVQIKHYILEYAETCPGVKPEECLWSKPTIVASDSPVTVILGLRPSTKYTLRVRCDCGKDGLGKEKSVVMCTDKQRLAESIKASSKWMESGPPSVYKLPLEMNDIGIDGCKSYTFGKHSERPNRTVIFLGETGAGKSTLINGMVNFILGIDWKDSFRYKLTDGGHLQSQTESQTSHVTAYKVNHQDGFKVPYSLTFVDTPGFCDTRGTERDKNIKGQIRRLFTSVKGLLEIDAICFVTPASVARLTPTQKYIFHSVLSIFGDDMVENICMLVTFADGQQPPVLKAINASNVPCRKTSGLPLHYKFNNSVLYADNRSEHDRRNDDSDEDMEVDNFDEKFWKMGAKHMKAFFKALDKMTTQSLLLTKEVLNERKQLEEKLKELQLQFRAKLAKLEENPLWIKENDTNITSNENNQSEVKIQVTNKAESMTNNQQFSGHNRSDVHTVKKTKVQEEEDEKDTGGKNPLEKSIKNHEEEKAKLEDELMSLMDNLYRCITRLSEMGMSPDPPSMPKYIDLLIEGESSEANPNLARIQFLKTMGEKAQIIATDPNKISSREQRENYTKKDQKHRQTQL